MSERKINLEEILKKFLTIEAMRLNNPDYTFNMVLSAMKDACRQTLELAAENATTRECGCHVGGFEDFSIIVNKQSILDTINQIK